MADEATTAATTTETTAPAVTEAPAVEAGEAKDTDKPAKPMSAIERATAAAEKLTAKGDEKDDKAAKPDESKGEKSEEKKPESEKVEPRLSRGLAILAAREEKVRTAEAALKSARFEHETKLAAESADLQLVREVKSALAKGGKAAALKVLGIDLKTGLEELSRSYEEPTAEDIARRVAAEEWENRQKAQEAAKAKEEAEKAERDQAATLLDMEEFSQKAFNEYNADPDSFVRLKAHGATPKDVYERFMRPLEAKLGRKVTALEALQAGEKYLRDRDNEAREREEARAKKSYTPTPKKSEQAKAKTEEPAKPQTRRPRAASPLDRAEQALKRLNIS